MNYAIANILNTYLTTLSFFDRVASVVRPISLITGAADKPVKKVYPVDCGVTQKQCVSGRYSDLIPDTAKKSVHYWEDGGVRSIQSNERDLRFESSLRLVGWLNLKKLGKTNCSVSAQAIMQIINTLPLGRFNSGEFKNIQLISISEAAKNSAIFSKYTYDETVTQYLMFPFDYYALDITLRFTISKACIEDFDLGTETDCEEK